MISEEKFTTFDLGRIPDKAGMWRLWTDTYWAIDKNGRGLKYAGSFQCNPLESIVRHVNSVEDHPGVDVVFKEKVWTR